MGGKKIRTPSQPEAPSNEPDTWGDAGRDVKSLGPITEVKESPARQPRPQTNWFNPNAGSREDSETSGTVDRQDSPGRTWSPDDPGSREKSKQSWKPTEKKGTQPVRDVERTVSRGTKGLPSPSWSQPEVEKNPTSKPGHVSPGKDDRKREEPRPTRDTRRPVVRESEPEPRPSWSQPTVAKKPEQKPSYAAPPRKQERKNGEVRRSSPPKETRKEQSKVSRNDEEKRRILQSRLGRRIRKSASRKEKSPADERGCDEGNHPSDDLVSCDAVVGRRSRDSTG